MFFRKLRTKEDQKAYEELVKKLKLKQAKTLQKAQSPLDAEDGNEANSLEENEQSKNE